MILFRGPHKVLDSSILYGTGFVGHTDVTTFDEQTLGVAPGRILRPLIGVKDKGGIWSVPSQTLPG